MANTFYLISGSAGVTSSVTYPVFSMTTDKNRLPIIGTGSAATISGQTALQVSSSGIPMAWISPPLSAITLSGSVTMSVWGFENANTNNATVGFRLWHKSGSAFGTGSETAMMTSVSGSATEFGNGIANNAARFASSNITTTTFRKDDRIVLRLYATNVGTMGTDAIGITVYYGSPNSGSSGDSFLRFSQDVPLKKRIVASR